MAALVANGTLPNTLHNRGWEDVLSSIDPFAFANLGAALALTLCVIGAAWCVGSGGLLRRVALSPRRTSVALLVAGSCNASERSRRWCRGAELPRWSIRRHCAEETPEA